jgi:hypothetical protein
MNKIALTIFSVGFTIRLFAAAPSGLGGTPLSSGGNVSSTSVSNAGFGIFILQNNGIGYSGAIQSIDIGNRVLYSPDMTALLNWGLDNQTLIIGTDGEVGGDFHVSGTTVMGDAVSQVSYATGPFYRMTNTFGIGGVQSGWTKIDINGDIITSNTVSGYKMAYTNGWLGLSSNIYIGNALYVGTTNVYINGQGTAAFTVINTNFVQGFQYVNGYGAPIQVVANIRITTAAVAGDASMDLQQPAGTLLNRVGMQSVAAQTNEVNLIGFIPAGGTYNITNTLTTGAGNTVIVIGGQIIVY